MTDWYLGLLMRTFGRNRALSVYVLTRRIGLGLLICVGLIAFGSFLYWATLRDDRLVHVDYFRADVTAITPLNNDENIGIIVDLTLPDGTAMRLVATESNITDDIDDFACVQHRRATESGKDSYRLRAMFRCAAKS